MDTLNDNIITVLTQDFSPVQTAIRNVGKGEVVRKSLLDLADTFHKYANTCGSIDHEIRLLNESGKPSAFIPFLNEGQLLEEIKSLPQTIIILLGIDPMSREYSDLRIKAWHRYEKVITEESYRGMAENFTQQFLDMYSAANPRNPNLPSAQDRVTTDPEERYAKFVELVNQRLTMKEIAIALGLSVPSTYLVRAQYKDRLMADANVNQSAPAMKFNGKRSK